MITCCKDCAERHFETIDGKLTTCHSTCERYKEQSAAYIAEQKEINRKIREEKQMDNYVSGVIREQKKRLRTDWKGGRR